MSVIDDSRILFEPAPVVRTWLRSIYFDMQEQCHSNWCWAATASSVSHYYSSGPHWLQCDIANAELHRLDCCNFACNDPNVDFNETNTLGSPLNRVRCHGGQYYRPLTIEELKLEIGEGRPVGARFAWQGGGAHFIVITGIGSDDRLSIADSFYESGTIGYSEFHNFYKNRNGYWTDSYKTLVPPIGAANADRVT